MSVDPDPLYETDVIKEILDEDGILTNERKIQHFGQEAQGEVQDELRYILPDSAFPLAEASFTSNEFTVNDFKIAQNVCNQLVRGKFWLESNDSKTVLEDARSQLSRFRDRLIQVPAATE